MAGFDVTEIRSRFPALQAPQGLRAPAWLDGPGGTQVPREVVAAMTGRLAEGVSNLGGRFQASRTAQRVVDEARAAVADLFAAAPDEVVFGQNMTSLTFSFSRALSRGWGRGDEVVVTRLDHEANVGPWVAAAGERGATVRWVEFDHETGLLDLDSFHAALGHSTRLVAVTAASNALGSVTPLANLVDAAHTVGAVVYVDAVHHSAHRLIDASEVGADFIAASAYKFFGPHTGMVIAKGDLLREVTPYRLRTAPDHGPGRWETGTQSFESLAGVTAAVAYLASLGDGATRRERLRSSFHAIRAHEDLLADRFLRGIAEMSHVRLYGPSGDGDRVSTFSFAVEGVPPGAVAARLAEDDIYAWTGNYYAAGVMESLGVEDSGGLVRIGFVHYNTAEEVDRALEVLEGPWQV